MSEPKEYWNFEDEFQLTWRMLGAVPRLVHALTGLLECFDQDGVFHTPDDIAVRWDDAREALEAAVGPDLFRQFEESDEGSRKP